MPKIIIGLVWIAVLFPSCRIVETMSESRVYSLKVEGLQPEQVSISVHDGSGNYTECERTDAGAFLVNIPEMHGGFSEFLSIKYNVHDPEEYKVVRILADDKIIREMSVREIEELPRQTDASYIISIDHE